MTPITPRALTAIVLNYPLLLIAATLAFLCFSNVVLCIQAHRLRIELFNLQSTLNADEARFWDQSSLGSRRVEDAAFTPEAK